MVPWLQVEMQVTIFSSLQAAIDRQRADEPAILVHVASFADRLLDENNFSYAGWPQGEPSNVLENKMGCLHYFKRIIEHF